MMRFFSKSGRWVFVGSLLLAMVFSISGLFSGSGAAMEKQMTAPFGEVKKKLVKDGFSQKRLDAVFSDPKVFFDWKNVGLFFMHHEGSLNYKQFSSPSSIGKAKAYMATHQEMLLRAEKKYGVSPEIVTAIILVETRLGTFTGRARVLNVLATLSSLSEKEARDILWKKTPSKKRFSREKFNKKARIKSKWGHRELRAFLTHTKKEATDPASIYGSYAGAMGIAQFMPSNVLTLARDGDMDGRINLFTHADAIMSVAHYLKYHGWRPGIASKKARDVIFRYNRSNYYVDAILDIARLLS